jgi:two-component system response regulator MprA
VGVSEQMARVLVVEDDLMIASMLEMILNHEQHTVYLAGDGASGVELASEHRPDVILMDIMLPRLSGLDAARKIRSSDDQQLAETPIVAMSAGSNLRTVADTGCFNSVLPKPFDIDTVVAILELHVASPDR